MSDEFISGAQMIAKVFKSISASDIEQNSKIHKAWEETVSKISGNVIVNVKESRVAISEVLAQKIMV